VQSSAANLQRPTTTIRKDHTEMFWTKKPVEQPAINPRGRCNVLISECIANAIAAAHPADKRSVIAGLARDLESQAALLKLRAQ
jgi:hypothetical protein